MNCQVLAKANTNLWDFQNRDDVVVRQPSFCGSQKSLKYRPLKVN